MKFIIVCKSSAHWEIYKKSTLVSEKDYYVLFATCSSYDYASEICKVLNK